MLILLTLENYITLGR